VDMFRIEGLATAAEPVQNGIFERNMGLLGGGVRVESSSSSEFINTTFAHNMASKGSAIYVGEGASAERIQACVFFNNSQATFIPEYAVGQDQINPLLAFEEETFSIFVNRYALSLSGFQNKRACQGLL
jgi:hypothetical protein